jgi:magnesium-transporting ATPase (P-type)
MFRLIERVLSWRLFSRRAEVARFRDILKWWELRRVPYNAIVGTAGVITCAVILAVAGIGSQKFNEPLGLPSPFFAVMQVLLFGIAANVCFTGGWIVEWLVRRIWRERTGAFGEISFFLGVVFSILLALLPSVVFIGLLIFRLLLGR